MNATPPVCTSPFHHGFYEEAPFDQEHNPEASSSSQPLNPPILATTFTSHPYNEQRNLSAMAYASANTSDISLKRINELNSNEGNFRFSGLKHNEIDELLCNYGEKLHSLTLQYKKRDIALRFINYCPNLEFLSLESCAIELEDLIEIAKMKDLKSLRIGGNYISYTMALAIAQMENLISLELWGNEIGDREAMAIARMENLTSLKLWGNKIGDEGAMAIANMKNLTQLDLRINEISHEGAKAIAEMEGLIYLNLGNNKIDDEGAMAIAKMKGLIYLSLYGTTTSAMKALKQ